MASDSEVDAPRVNGTVEDAVLGGLDPSTPQEHETGAHPLSQITLPSTEMPGSPIDANQSFKTEVMDDRPAITVIPSSLTPPPSTQVAASNGASRRTYSNSQQSALFSPPATILNTMRERDIESDYTPPAPHRVLEASAEELRAMLQTCIAENQKLKMEAAHHKLQYNLLSLQADEESKRAAVEHDMVRREVDALRMAEHSRQAKRELSTVSESIQNKYLQMKMWYESAMEENEALSRRVKLAKKVIQQKEEETMTLAEEREMLLNRIRENREHFHMLCSPGGIFHNALTPKQVITSTPQQQQQQHRTTSRALHREETDGREHGLSALLEAMSQSQSQENNAATMAATNNNSAPSTPMVMARPASRLVRRHQRNAQSMSSLPTTPSSRLRGDNSGLLPSVNLVAQTEPRSRYSQRRFVPTTPPSQRQSRRRRRESTISADDNEELARQAIESVKAVQSLSTQDAPEGVPLSSQEDEEQIQDSQASQAAAEMLRRHPGQGYKAPSSRDGTAGPAEKSAAMHAKLFAGSKTATGAEKRKLTAEGETGADEMESPQKKLRAGGAASEGRRVGLAAVLAKAPSDIVILSSLRTPICRSSKGHLKDAYPEELLSAVLKATRLAVPEMDPALVDDVGVGVVLSELGGSKAGRMALNHAGYPNSTSLFTANRACASSLQSISLVAAEIQNGMVDVGIGAGMESMTRNYGSKAVPVDVWPALRHSETKHVRDCVMPMGLTSENVAERYGVDRGIQDQVAAESHVRAARARDAGWFDSQIVPVTTRFQEVDKQGNAVGEEQQITVTRDDGIRTGVTAEALAKLKPAFKPDGKSTAGNSSQISDGAAATLLMRRSTATELGLSGRIMGKFVGATTVGCDPDEMGIGPALAIPKLLNRLGLKKEDVDRWEINEAFASQVVYCLRELGLMEAWEKGKVNPDGGAIALGHPLGATGARMTSTLMHGLARQGGEVGVVSMCVGTGMGMAGLFVRE
ncbi:3-ketoacyl-CoA thiolase 2, peroxisomal [Trichoderma lentiforme]|uniref:acetyl-CoA C-acyltransferase n=1 Tax=Trichoderma lentiforme TaxID=1567552 RepID=A0A9P5CBV2_9HYPO|nr:3-ketoacyl-CoA thiolase 2, peroxisomal [Trichoderma lentiforme]